MKSGLVALSLLSVTQGFKLAHKATSGPEDDLIDLDTIGIEPTPAAPTPVAPELAHLEADAGEGVEESISSIAAGMKETK